MRLLNKINKQTLKKILFTSFLVFLVLPISQNSIILEADTNQNVSNVKNSATWENIPLTDVDGGPLYNYADYLAGSIMFYEANKCGPNQTGINRFNWRGDCHVNDSAIYTMPDGTELHIDATGGYHDAGDHIKFGMTNAYMASTLGWGFYQFRDQYEQTGQNVYMLETLKYVTDYFIRCHPVPEVFLYHVGSGADHNVWAPPELQSDEECPRDTSFATPTTPASDVCGATAAALAIMYLNYRSIDVDYANTCLEHALQLYAMGTTYLGLGDGYGFYPSASFYDDLAWAAIWLYKATGNAIYLDQLASYTYANTGGLDEDSNIENGINWVNYWTHCWDAVWGGVFIVAANETRHPAYIEQANANIDYWMSDALETTPGGMKHLNGWGVLRYSTAEALMILAHHDNFGNDAYRDFAASQMHYAMGSNPAETSYFVGIGDKTAEHPHHRAAHGSETRSMLDPENHKHVLYGALVGGPNTTDEHHDVCWDYIANEVSIDYNAGATGALAGMLKFYGTPDQMPGPGPAPDVDVEPYYVEAKVESDNQQRTQISLFVNNKASTPPHVETELSFRYFMDLSEIYDGGYDVSTIELAVYYNPYEAGHVTGVLPFDEDNHIYYVEIDFYGYPLLSSHEFQFALIFQCPPGAGYEEIWDSSNDFSFSTITSELTKNYNMPLYRAGELLWGNEPLINENAPPSISSPADITYSEGTTGNEISWTLTDNNPATYTITGPAGTSTPAPWTNGDIITESIDGLYEGSYVYTITATDSEGLSSSNGVNVLVTFGSVNIAPTISSPVDIAYQEGDISNHEISWTLADSNPATYTIDGPSGTSSPISWVNGEIITESVSGLAIGTHIYTITATDAEGLSSTDSVNVIVSEATNVAPSVTSPADIEYLLGATGNSISWTLTDSNPATYTITGPSGTSAPVTWANGAVITESVDELAVGAHTYTITATDEEGLSTSDSVDVVVSLLLTEGGDVSIEDITGVKVGDTFDATIFVDTGIQRLAGYGLVISYDPAIINATSVVASSGGFMAAVNIDRTLGTITVAGFDAAGLEPNTALDLIVISWKALTEGNSAIDIQVNELVDETTAVIGTPNGISNSIIVGPAFDLGDVNNDEKVDIVDALLVAQFYVGEVVSIDETLADVNLDGEIDIIDALLIAQFYVGVIPVLPPDSELQ